MRQGISFIDWHGVTDTITRIQHNTCSTSTGIQGEHGLDSDIHSWHIEGLEHDLGHFLPVSLGVERGLGQQHRVLFRRNTELVVEGVMPDLLHVIPVANNTMFDRVL
uniref:Uncharacterized protein n=1 Tax=Oryza brachyantha TaxID=4533 RepID=J3N6A4_ORYBR